MIKIFYNLTFVVLSSLGIGYLSRFREILTVIFSALFVLILPESERPLILTLVIIFFISFFELTFNFVKDNLQIRDKLVFRHSVGIWLSMLSPFVYFSFEWILIDVIIFLIIRKLIVALIKKDYSIETGRFKFISIDIISGFASMLIFQIIYSSFNLLFFTKYLYENFN